MQPMGGLHQEFRAQRVPAALSRRRWVLWMLVLGVSGIILCDFDVFGLVCGERMRARAEGYV